MSPSAIPAPIAINPSMLLWFFFAIVMLVTIYFVFAHLYHWLRYSSLYPLVWVALPLYLGGVFVCMTTMLGAIALV